MRIHIQCPTVRCVWSEFRICIHTYIYKYKTYNTDIYTMLIYVCMYCTQAFLYILPAATLSPRDETLLKYPKSFTLFGRTIKTLLNFLYGYIYINIYGYIHSNRSGVKQEKILIYIYMSNNNVNTVPITVDACIT